MGYLLLCGFIIGTFALLKAINYPWSWFLNKNFEEKVLGHSNFNLAWKIEQDVVCVSLMLEYKILEHADNDCGLKIEVQMIFF